MQQCCFLKTPFCEQKVSELIISGWFRQSISRTKSSDVSDKPVTKYPTINGLIPDEVVKLIAKHCTHIDTKNHNNLPLNIFWSKFAIFYSCYRNAGYVVDQTLEKKNLDKWKKFRLLHISNFFFCGFNNCQEKSSNASCRFGIQNAVWYWSKGDRK